jgi:hypothetical protein
MQKFEETLCDTFDHFNFLMPKSLAKRPPSLSSFTGGTQAFLVQRSPQSISFTVSSPFTSNFQYKQYGGSWPPIASTPNMQAIVDKEDNVLYDGAKEVALHRLSSIESTTTSPMVKTRSTRLRGDSLGSLINPISSDTQLLLEATPSPLSAEPFSFDLGSP